MRARIRESEKCQIFLFVDPFFHFFENKPLLCFFLCLSFPKTKMGKNTKDNKKQLNWTIGLLADASLGFCWWTFLLMTADHAFFFPLFDMGISGYEFPLVALLFGGGLFHVSAFGRTFTRFFFFFFWFFFSPFFSFSISFSIFSHLFQRKYAPYFALLALSGFFSVNSSAAFKIVWSSVAGLSSFLALAGIASSPLEVCK